MNKLIGCLVGIGFSTFAFGAVTYDATLNTADTSTFGAGRIAVLDLGLEAGKRASYGCASDPQTFVNVLGESYEVTVVNRAGLEDASVFDCAKTDLIIVPSGALFPYACQDPMLRFLKSGGLLLTCGGYAFDAPCVWKDGAWQPAAPAANPPKPACAVPVALPPPDAWRDNTFPTTTTRISSIRGTDAESGFRIETPQMRGWNMKICGVRPFPAGTGALALRARADAHTRCLLVELNERDGTRWQAYVPVADDWGEIVLDWTDFTFHPDSPTKGKGRGGAADRISFADVVSFSAGFTRRGNGNPGDLALRRRARFVEIADVRTGADSAAARRHRPAPIESISSRPWQHDVARHVNAFFPYYRYDGVLRLGPAPETDGLFPRLTVRGPLAGWDASGRVSRALNGHAPEAVEMRPLLTCFELNGAQHGLGGSILHHHDGPFKGGTWAVFGVESTDLFAQDGSADFLRAVVRALFRRVWLTRTRADLVCRRVGEKATFLTSVNNASAQAFDGKVTFALSDEVGNVVARGETSVSVPAGGTADAAWSWTVPAGAGEYYECVAKLVMDGEIVDRASDALAVWDEARVRRGPTVSRGAGCVLVNGRNRFLVGAQAQVARNMTDIGVSARRSRAECREMSRAGLTFTRSFYGLDFALEPESPRAQRLVRAMDAVVLFAQKYELVHYFTPCCGNELGRGGRAASLANEARWLKFFAERYRGVSGLLWDIRNEPWLTPLPGERLEDAVAWMRHWAENASAAILSVNPDALVGVGWGQGWQPWGRVMDPPFVGQGHNLTDCHYYGPGEDFCVEIKKMDRRVFGVPLCAGEFGCAFSPEGIPQRNEYLTEKDAERRFCQQTLRAFGLGCSFISHYGFEEQIDGTLSFALVHHDFYPRSCFAIYQRLARTLGAFERAPAPPDTVLVFSRGRFTATSHAEMRRAVDGANLAIASLAWHGANFSVIEEHEVGRLPSGIRCLLRSADFEALAETNDRALARRRVCSALALTDAFATRRPEDDAEVEIYCVRGTHEHSAWVLWNDSIERTQTVRRFGREFILAPQHGAFVVTDAYGTPLRGEMF